MRVLILLAVFLGTAFAFAPCAKIPISKNQQSTSALKLFGSDAISTLLSMDVVVSQQPLIIAGAVALLGIAAFTVSNGNKSDSDTPATASPKAASAPEKKVEAVDVSIPYNAAAMLEYTKLMGSKYDAAKFAKFEAIYLQKVVAQVTAKKVARDSQLELARYEAIVAKADADLAELTK